MTIQQQIIFIILLFLIFGLPLFALLKLALWLRKKEKEKEDKRQQKIIEEALRNVIENQE